MITLKILLQLIFTYLFFDLKNSKKTRESIMKNLKNTLIFMTLFMLCYIPLAWPFTLLRLIPYFFMFRILTKALSQIPNTKHYTINAFLIGVIFDTAPMLLMIPFVTTTLIFCCAISMLFFSTPKPALDHL